MAVVELTISDDKHDGYLYRYGYCGYYLPKDGLNCADSGGHATPFTVTRNQEYASQIATSKRDLVVGTNWDNYNIQHVPNPKNGPRINIYRAVMRFAVPSGTTTDGKRVVLRLYGRADITVKNYKFVGTNPTTPSNLDIQVHGLSVEKSNKFVKRDYSASAAAYSSQFSDLPENGGWVDIPLNSAASTAIQSAAGSTFPIMIREYSHDIQNSSPGFVEDDEVMDGSKTFLWQFASQYSTSQQPRIVISDAGFQHKLLGIENTGIKKVNDLSMSSPQVIERINDIQ